MEREDAPICTAFQKVNEMSNIFSNDPNKDAMADRFIRYASICTQSSEGADDTPSTSCQRELAVLLYQELKQMGASEVHYDEVHCYVYATLPGNLPVDLDRLARREDARSKRRENMAPIIGLVAHLDTSDAVSATEIHPRKIDYYDGKVITLNASRGIVSDPSVFTDLQSQVGNMLIVTDGNSVLGGDDKAGVAEIMELFRFYLEHPEYPHGTVRLMFTPDEEVGCGTMHADLSIFAVDYAYTLDGSEVGEFSYENFNAASADIVFHGVSTHPGDAYHSMRNATLMAMEFDSLLPAQDRPENTKDYEGFFFLSDIHGTCEETIVSYLIRDFDTQSFIERKEKLLFAAKTMNQKYGKGAVTITIEDSYFNMAERILPHPELIENVKKAMKASGITPRILPTRGGTDGCVLSFMGVPCPNLGTGAYRYHSRYEYVSIDDMCKCTEIVIRLIGNYANYELSD